MLRKCKMIIGMMLISCMMFGMVGCGKSAENISGLWLSDEKTEDGETYGIYFASKTRVMIETVEKDGNKYIMGKAAPYQCSRSSDEIILSAGSEKGEEFIAADEESDGIPLLEFDGKKIKAKGGDIDGMTFSYAAEKCEYTIDY